MYLCSSSIDFASFNATVCYFLFFILSHSPSDTIFPFSHPPLLTNTRNSSYMASGKLLARNSLQGFVVGGPTQNCTASIINLPY